MQLIHDLFLWIYTRPIPQLLLFISAASVVFLLARKTWENHTIWKCLLILALILWSAAVVYSTVSGRDASGTITHTFAPFYSYRELVNGGNPEILRSNFMNIVLFYPAGLVFVSLLPKKLPGWCRVLLALVLFAAFSAGIEYFQYAGALGNAETDDVIHNTLGGLLGGSCALARSTSQKPT